MAVVHVKEVVGRDGESDQRENKQYTRIFQVLTSDPTDGAKTIRDHADIPNYGDPWESYKAGVLIDQDLDARCVHKTAAQGDGENLQNWVVTCQYVGVGDPTLEPPRVQWTEENWQETKNTDYNGNLVCNSAGEPFESGLTRDRTRGVVIIEQNVLVYDPIEAEEYRDTTNALPFLVVRHPPGFGVGKCKIMSISAVPVFYPNYPDTIEIHYWRRTVKVAIDRNLWDAVFVDQGTKERIFNVFTGTFELMPIIGPNGQPHTTPVLLDGTGLQLELGLPPVYTDPFQRYEEKDWTPLNIDY